MSLARRTIHRTQYWPVERQAANIMEPETIQVVAGFTSAIIFASSKIPMLTKAFRTKDLRSYSLGHIVLSNTGNLMYWLYVISLPAGPIWFLQGFFTMTDMLMLLCYVRYRKGEEQRGQLI